MLFHKKQLTEQSLLLFLFLMPFLLRGQIKKKGEDQTKAEPVEQIVKISPISMIDPFGPTFTACFEQQLRSRRKWTSFENEVGYTFSVTGLSDEAIGYRLRSAYRHYRKNKWKEKGNGYFSFALMQRQVFDKGSKFLWRTDRNFQQNLDYQLRISQQSAAINWGFMRYFGKNNAFNLDMSIGLGFRRSRILFKGLPNDAFTPDIPDVYERNFKEYLGQTTVKDRTHFFYSTALGVKLGYVLQKNSLTPKR